MNKKYFVKYLPVEGEIKAGDMVLKPPIPHLGMDNPYIEEVDGCELEILADSKRAGHSLIKGSKLAKLFLCSRDIQVGDEIIYEVTGAKFKWDGNMPQRPEDFKVIGEISKDALGYVKEGDEFDDQDVKFMIKYYWAFSGDTPKIESVSCEEWVKTVITTHDTVDKWITIKCSTCSHFH